MSVTRILTVSLVLADVPVMDAQGRKSTARKLLKFYNLV